MRGRFAQSTTSFLNATPHQSPRSAANSRKTAIDARRPAGDTSRVTAYGLTLLIVCLVAPVAGYMAGRQFGPLDQTRQRRFAVAVIGLAVFWFIAGWISRQYAETDKPGWIAAEWFAHRGKWFVLLAGTLAALGFTVVAEKVPGYGNSRRAILRRLLLVAAVALVIGTVIHRTIPIYPWLDAGMRDPSGLLRQSLRFEFTCAPVALANYLERFADGPLLTEQAISRDCRTTREGSTQSDVLRAARRHGLARAECRKLTLADLNERTLPAIVSISTLPGVRHATLLVRLDADGAYFLDPAYGEWSIPPARFEQIWYGKTLVLNPR
jgi:hypothetical protein